MLQQLIGFSAGLTIFVEDLGTSLEPDWLLEGDTVSSQQLRGDATQSTKHGPPGVDHLNLPVPVFIKNRPHETHMSRVMNMFKPLTQNKESQAI